MLDDQRIKEAESNARQYLQDEQAKRGKAIISLERAKEFVFEMKKLL